MIDPSKDNISPWDAGGNCCKIGCTNTAVWQILPNEDWYWEWWICDKHLKEEKKQKE